MFLPPTGWFWWLFLLPFHPSIYRAWAPWKTYPLKKLSASIRATFSLRKLFFKLRLFITVQIALWALSKLGFTYVKSTIDPLLLPLEVYEVPAFASATPSSANSSSRQHSPTFLVQLPLSRVHTLKSLAMILSLHSLAFTSNVLSICSCSADVVLAAT